MRDGCRHRNFPMSRFPASRTRIISRTAVGILCTRDSLQHAFVPPWTAFVCDRYMGSMGAPNHFGTNTTMVEYFGVMTIVYAAAALLSLGVEFPFAQLEKLLLFPAKKRVWV